MLPCWIKRFIGRLRPSQQDAERPIVEDFRSSSGFGSRKQTSIVLVEDNIQLSVIIKRILEKEFEFNVVAEANDGRIAHDLLVKFQSAVLVIDMELPGLSGIELIGYACEHFPAIAIVAVSIHREDPYVRRALDRGAKAFVHKSCLHDHLAAAVRSALAEKLFIRLY